MARSKSVTLWDLLIKIPDHRTTTGRRYRLASVLAIALAAIVRFGRRLKPYALNEMGIYERQAPCPATYHYIFRDLNI